MKKILIYKYPFWQKYPKFLLDAVIMINFLMFIFLGFAVILAALTFIIYRLSGLSNPVIEDFFSSLEGEHYLGGAVAVVLGYALQKECRCKIKDWIVPLEITGGTITSIREEYTAGSDSGADRWFVYIGDLCWEIPDRVVKSLTKGQTVEIHATAAYKEVRAIYRIGRK